MTIIGVLHGGGRESRLVSAHSLTANLSTEASSMTVTLDSSGDYVVRTGPNDNPVIIAQGTLGS